MTAAFSRACRFFVKRPTILNSVLLQTQRRTLFRLAGVYPTVVTPFTSQDEESIDFGRFERMLQHLNRYSVEGFALLASHGEFSSLDYAKKLDLVKFAREYLGSDRVVMAGAGLESTVETLDLVRRMAKSGADACFVYNPSFFREQMHPDSYIYHFTKIADNSPIPVVLYNVPAHTDMDIPVEVVEELSRHPKIVGLVDTGGDIARIATICMKTQETSSARLNPFNVVAGSASFYFPALLVGCSGTVCGLANILPFELIQLRQLVEERKLKQARELQWRLLLPNEAIQTERYGVAGLKAVIKAFLDIDMGSVKLPLRNLNPDEIQECVAIFEHSGFLRKSSY